MGGSKPGEGGEFRRPSKIGGVNGKMGEVLTISLVSTAELLCVALEGADEDGQYASVPEHCLVLSIVADQLEECVQDPGHGLRVPIRRGGEGRGGEGRGGEGRGGEGRGGEGGGEGRGGEGRGGEGRGGGEGRREGRGEGSGGKREGGEGRGGEEEGEEGRGGEGRGRSVLT